MIDKLREDLRVLYSRKQADLGDVQEARGRVLRAALAARDEPPVGRLHFAAGVAAIVLAALVVGTFAYVRATNSPHVVTPPKASPVPSAGPKAPVELGEFGVGVLDAAPLDASTGWVLVTTCYEPVPGESPPPCRYAVAHTTDGGRTWSKPVQVGPPSDGSDFHRKLTFINANDGFEYGATSAFVTHDGGKTWTPAGLAPSWLTLIKGRGTTAWVMSNQCSFCLFEVRSSLDAGRTWSSPHSLPAGFAPQDAVSLADTGLLISSAGGDMELTLDRGTTWRFVATHCPMGTVPTVATSDGNELWQLCFEGITPGRSKLFVSTNGGRSWLLRTSPPLVEKIFPSASILVSPRAGTAVFASGSETIKITHDGGRTWSTVGEGGIFFQSINFANATDGWAVSNLQIILTTSDGGDHWE